MTNPVTSLVQRPASLPRLPLLPPSPSTAVINVPRGITEPQGFVEEDDEGDLDHDENEEKVLRALEQLGKARGRGRYTCPLGKTCQKGGLYTHGELKIFEQNGAYRLDNPPLVFFVWVS